MTHECRREYDYGQGENVLGVPLIRNRLLRLMHERDLSDGSLAELTGLSRARINRLKNHRARPTVRDALLITRVLDVTVDEAFSIEPETPPSVPDVGRARRLLSANMTNRRRPSPGEKDRLSRSRGAA